ncbi:MAG: heavy-metal-associated domain-containing protein [Anaerolineales bacterium]|nr:heavy-metal-associated domain-containing protein [Anaerolineales bacterium]
MTSTTYKIPNISCNHCVKTIEFELGEIPGVENVKADAETKTAKVVYLDPATEEQITDLLAKINYPSVQ